MIASNYLYRSEAGRHRWVPALFAVSVLVALVGGAPSLIREAVRALSLQVAAPSVVGALGPFVFLLFILVISRLATHGPVDLLDDRTLVRRWLTDGALFAFAMAALLLCAVAMQENEFRPLSDLMTYRVREIIMPALSEEIAFRGFLTVALTTALGAAVRHERRRPAVAVMLASGAFALAHQHAAIEPTVALAVRFAAGLTFGFLTLHSRSLVPAMFAHAAVNGGLLRC